MPIYRAEIDALPDPETFGDALLLAERGTWTPASLDEADALLLALVRRIQTVGRKKG